jgi:hypothetical protein
MALTRRIVPMEFFHDTSFNPNCLDRSDEAPDTNYISSCYRDPSFRCEEHTCRPGDEEFARGDGECITETGKCFNGRTSFLPIDFCSNATACSMTSMGLVDIRNGVRNFVQQLAVSKIIAQ